MYGRNSFIADDSHCLDKLCSSLGSTVLRSFVLISFLIFDKSRASRNTVFYGLKKVVSTFSALRGLAWFQRSQVKPRLRSRSFLFLKERQAKNTKRSFYPAFLSQNAVWLASFQRKDCRLAPMGWVTPLM